MLFRKLYDPDAGQGGGTTIATDTTGTAGNNGAGNGAEHEVDPRVKRANAEAAEARVKLRELEQKLATREKADADAEAERAKQQGEYQKLYEKADARVRELEAATADREAIAAERDTLVKQRRTDLLDRLPKDKRKDYEADDVTLGEIERAVKNFGSIVGAASSGNRNSVASEQAHEGKGVKDPKEITFQHLNDLRSSGDTEGYTKALKQFKAQQSKGAARFAG